MSHIVQHVADPVEQHVSEQRLLHDWNPRFLGLLAEGGAGIGGDQNRRRIDVTIPQSLDQVQAAQPRQLPIDKSRRDAHAQPLCFIRSKFDYHLDSWALKTGAVLMLPKR